MSEVEDTSSEVAVVVNLALCGVGSKEKLLCKPLRGLLRGLLGDIVGGAVGMASWGCVVTTEGLDLAVVDSCRGDG